MGLILLYHRVCDLESDPQRLAVRPDRFSKQLAVLSAQFTPVPLLELAEHARRNTLPRHAVAVTFDDGYADNLEQARPLLERFGVSATVFVASSYIGGEREFWWDDLERLLLTEGQLPQRLQMRVGRDTREWDLGSASVYGVDMCRRHAGWTVERRDHPTARHLVYRDLCGLLRTCSTADREAALEELASQAEGTQTPRGTHRPLSAADLSQLGDGGLVEIGAHSANHPTLSALPFWIQKEEIDSSKARVEALTGRRASAFAYPFGTPGDYTASTVDLVRDAGFACACVATPGRVEPGEDLLRLPRVIVRDWDVDEFRNRLKAWS